MPEHPYHQKAEVAHYVARYGRQLLGRVSAAVNHRFNEHYGSKIGFFGFFDVCDDYEVAEALLTCARDWIRDRGMTAIRLSSHTILLTTDSFSNATDSRRSRTIMHTRFLLFPHPSA